MFSKLNCLKFQTNFDHTKETKIQKYLRERNEKILEKCFNIQMEKPSKEEQQKSNHEKLPGQPSRRKPYQHEGNNIIMPITNNNNSVEIDLKQSQLKEETKPTISEKNIMESSKSKPHLINPRKQRPKTAPNYSPTASVTKSLKTPQAARSPTSINWKSPFNTVITTGVRSRLHHSQQSSEFAYDLSREELKFAGKFRSPMKPAPDAERQLLKNGPRRDYLTKRYEHSPVVKYNYPEATSWRIGWLQQLQ